MCRGVTLCQELLHTGGIGSPGEVHGDGCSVSTSISPAVWVCDSKAWGTTAPTPLSHDPGMRDKEQCHAGLCSQGQTLPCLCCLAQELGYEKILLRSLHIGAGAGGGGGECLGWGVWVCA